MSFYGYTRTSMALAVVLLIAQAASAETWTNGTGTGLWNDAGNWDTNAVPGDWSSLTFGGPAGGIVDLGGGATAPLSQVYFQNNVNSYTLTHGTLVTQGISSGGWLTHEIAADVTSPWGWIRLQNYNSLLISGAIKDLDGSGTATDVWGPAKFAGTNTYTGATHINGGWSATLLSPYGSMLTTSAINIAGTMLTIDNTNGNNDNRIAVAAPMTLRFADLNYLGSNTGPSAQALGNVTLEGGYNTLQGDAGIDNTDVLNPIFHTATLTLNSLNRELEATLKVSPYVSNSNPITIQLNTSPTLVGGGGTAGSTSMSILPWAIFGDGSFATVETTGATPQLRGLNSATEYATDLATASATDNVWVAGYQTLASHNTVNALRIDGSVHLAGPTQLTVAGGAMSITSAGEAIITGDEGASLHFGATEGIVHLFDSNTSIDVPIFGSKGLTISGGWLTLNCANPDLSGPLTVNGGFVASPVQGALGTGQIILRGTGSHNPATVVFTGVDQTLVNDVLMDTTVKTSPESGEVNAATFEIASGITVTHTGAFSGQGGFYKTGQGTMIFTGHSVTQEFVFQIGQGLGQFDGILETESGGWISSYIYGTLTGTGTINGVVNAYSGTVAPGHGLTPGVLNTYAVIAMSGGHLAFTITGPTAGSEYSQLTAQSAGGGYVMLDSSSAALDLTLTYAPPLGQTFELIDFEGLSAIQGTFMGLPEGSMFTTAFNGTEYGFQVSYVGGTGNDLVLTTVPVPEPATLSLLALGAVAMLRRRK